MKKRNPSIRENLSIITVFPNEARPFYNNTTQTAFFGLSLINLFAGIIFYIFDALYFAFFDPIQIYHLKLNILY